MPRPLLIALTWLLTATLGTAFANRKNVLLIAIDDLRPELRCYGQKHAPSPNIDRLAESGVVFKNHFVQVPTCGASRYALLTGRSPAKSQAFANDAFYRGSTALSHEPQLGSQSLPEIFRRNGYHTTLIGKISHTADGKVFAYDGTGNGSPELPHAWDEFATPLGQWKRGWGIFFAYANGLHREDGLGNRKLTEFVVEKDTDLPDGLLAETAINKLTDFKKGDPPFFIGLGFLKPHLPFVATKDDWEAAEKIKIPPPAHPEKPNSPYWHKSREFFRYEHPHKNENRTLSPKATEEARRSYLACVRYVDRQIGKILDTLDATGLTSSTIVILWGDHGWHLGDSAIWGKHTPFERALHSPLIIRAPGTGKHGTASNSLAETTDIYPTLLELCGPFGNNKTAHPLDGTSLVPILKNPEKSVHQAAISYWKNATSIRTKDYRLITSKKSTELYDLSKDQYSTHNLAAEKPETVRRLQALAPK